MAKRKPQPPARERLRRSSEFGALLKRYRSLRGINQQEIADLVGGRTASFVQKIEAGDRGHDFTREDVWKIISHLEVWPPDCDDLLRNAGFSADRTGDEEQEVQRRMPFAELWVFARRILDPDGEWYDVVKRNLQEGRHYRYFTSDRQPFVRLLRALRKDLSLHDQDAEPILCERLECFVLPEDLFLSNFALYIPPTPDIDRGRMPQMSRIYGCGTKPIRGRTDVFFTMNEDEAEDLFKVLQGWRDRAIRGEDIFLRPMSQVFPNTTESKFTSVDAVD